MKSELAKGENGDVEFCSWGLSAMGELVSGNGKYSKTYHMILHPTMSSTTDAHRKEMMAGGAKVLVLDMLALHVNDVYTQWQGLFF